MRILILAAGFGTRLQSYGETTPKGLVPTSSGALMNKVIDECSLLSSPLALVTNDRFYKTYADWFAQNYPKLSLELINDGAGEPDSRLGAIGDISYVLEDLQWHDDDLLVVPSDTFFEFSLSDFVTFAQQKRAFATVIRDLHDKALIANRLGCATVENGQIVSFLEKPEDPPTTLAAIPFYYYPKSVLALLPAYRQSGGNMDAPGSIIPWLLTRGQDVRAFVIDSPTLDVGTVDDVSQVRLL